VRKRAACGLHAVCTRSARGLFARAWQMAQLSQALGLARAASSPVKPRFILILSTARQLDCILHTACRTPHGPQKFPLSIISASACSSLFSLRVLRKSQIMTRCTVLCVLVAVVAANNSTCGGDQPSKVPDCDKTDFGSCGNACCSLLHR
jgi:hypothetical protein